jgi:hypothetical protein
LLFDAVLERQWFWIATTYAALLMLLQPFCNLVVVVTNMLLLLLLSASVDVPCYAAAVNTSCFCAVWRHCMLLLH